MKEPSAIESANVAVAWSETAVALMTKMKLTGKYQRNPLRPHQQFHARLSWDEAKVLQITEPVNAPLATTVGYPYAT